MAPIKQSPSQLQELQSDGWLRLPAAQKQFGVSRSWLYNAINGKLIQSKAIRRPGCTKGIRVVYAPSIARFFALASD
jgi:hypothetical protein